VNEKTNGGERAGRVQVRTGEVTKKRAKRILPSTERTSAGEKA